MENEENNLNTSKEEVETPKTYSQEELDELLREKDEANQKAWDKRWGKEKSKMEREFAKDNEKKNELIDLFMAQTGAKNIDDLADMSYKQYGVERPETKNSDKDDEILGKNDAKEIMEFDDTYIEQEANRLANKKRTSREETTFMELGAYLTDKKQKQKILNEIKENGLDESILDDKEFNEFKKKFNDNTSIKEVYDIFQSTKTPAEQPYNAGSLKDSKPSIDDNALFTFDEFMALTDEDLKNPKIYEKAMKSRINFK